ncbi:unnamed protein product [Onchocerca ochengi]|uniref:DDA1 domain-containing protein n=1 Tax=Onchocerca ochengi TaxID=42157 RepID=A0A182E2R7_ONCOC|nr:unnamed protein product [Onchocerca ochengi]
MPKTAIRQILVVVDDKIAITYLCMGALITRTPFSNALIAHSKMSAADFLKDLPSRNKANFSSFLKQNGKPVVDRVTQQTDDEKRIIFDMKPLLLRYLQSNWGNNPSCSTSSIRSTRSERKRTSDLSSSTTDESENTSGARVKTRRRE